MSADQNIRTLSSEVKKGIQVLDKIGSRLDAFLEGSAQNQDLHALAVMQLLSNYYTCAETIFLRISRFFENSLPSEKWYQVLLERMTLEIEDYRPRVITDDVHDDLRELLKFRHFSRYYFDLEYDWDRLKFHLEKFSESRNPLKRQLKEFDDYLMGLLNSG